MSRSASARPTSEPVPPHLAPLNEAQRAAATVPAPVLLLAGAGSGKTETLTRRVADLILARGEAPERLLCITFTARAAEEMRTRLVALLGPARTPRWVGTFHAIMARLLIEDGADALRLPRGFVILNQHDARTVLMQVAGIDDAKEGSTLAEAVSLVRNALPASPRRSPRSTALARLEPELVARATKLLPAYAAALERQGALDFDDLIVRPVAAMRADPLLAARWSGRWSEILVDEYQDTNDAQHALVRLLAGGAGRVFAVGDDLQAIYGWRGAEVTHIRRFGKDHPRAPTPLALEINYRSTPTILRAANAVASRDHEALPKTLRSADPRAPAGAAIAVRALATPEDEGAEVVRWLRALRERQTNLPWRSCAVLFRAAFVAEAIVVALRAAGIPAHRTMEREPEPPKEVLAAIAWLRLAASREAACGVAKEVWDPAADDAFRRACAFPPRGIGRTLFEQLRDHAAERGVALAGAVASLPVAHSERLGLDAVLGIAREIADGVARHRLGPADSLRLAAEAGEIAERLQVGRTAAAWESALRRAEAAGSVRAYCDGAALGAGLGEAEAPDAVRMMTLHRAKGLEFDHVLLAGLEEGVWPSRQAEQQGALAEERRLFYVGVTRARHSLCLSWVRHRREWAAKPSRFLAEIVSPPPPSPPPDGRRKEDRSPGRTTKPSAPVSGPPKMVPPPSQAEVDRLVQNFRARRSGKGAR